MKSLTIKSILIILISIPLLSSCGSEKSKWGPDIYKPDTTFKVVGYISSWSFDRIDELEIEKLTYLNLAFANPDKAGNCIVKAFFRDEDGDGYGNMSKPYHACTAPPGYVANMDDSDDTNPGKH
jgi:GH18 family chitinase